MGDNEQEVSSGINRVEDVAMEVGIELQTMSSIAATVSWPPLVKAGTVRFKYRKSYNEIEYERIKHTHARTTNSVVLNRQSYCLPWHLVMNMRFDKSAVV